MGTIKTYDEAVHSVSQAWYAKSAAESYAAGAASTAQSNAETYASGFYQT